MALNVPGQIHDQIRVTPAESTVTELRVADDDARPAIDGGGGLPRRRWRRR